MDIHNSNPPTKAGNFFTRFIRKQIRITTRYANPIDWAMVVYLILVSVSILIFHEHQPEWKTIFWKQIGIIALVFFILRFLSGHRWFPLRMIHHWYPVFLFTFFYITSGLLNQMVFQGYWDDFFAGIDRAMFGTNPNIWLYDRLNTYYFNELMHLCYFSYYFIPLFLGIVLYVQGNGDYMRILFGISVAFYVCYLLYIFIPAAGPIPLREGRFLDGGWFVHTMNWIYENAETPGAAFPSSHVAISFMTLMYAYRLKRVVFWIILPFVTGLIFSTMYCFYHYVIDVIGGLALCIALYYWVNRWFDRLYAKNYFPKYTRPD